MSSAFSFKGKNDKKCETTKGALGFTKVDVLLKSKNQPSWLVFSLSEQVFLSDIPAYPLLAAELHGNVILVAFLR